MESFSKKERLCSAIAIDALIKKGRFCTAPGLNCRYIHREDTEPSRIMISVPKKLFKRAVKRNLFKRRIREAYRKQKTEINGGPYDILFIYSTKEELSYTQLYEAVAMLLKQMH